MLNHLPPQRRAQTVASGVLRAGLVFLLVAGGLLAASASMAATNTGQAPRIGVMTMQPGNIFWERFGHDAIVVVDGDTGLATSYNYGFFDPGEPGFVGRFARGKMQYMLAAVPLEQDLATYRDEGRGVSIQWLDLAPAQALHLQHALEVESRPENARYHYDYFIANCATKVRDALDDALGGRLRDSLVGRSRGTTYRSEAVRLASPATWMWLGFDIGLSGNADKPLTHWQDAFIPMRLADSLSGVRLADGRPLVAGTQVVLPHRIDAEPLPVSRPWWPWGLAGFAIAIAIVAVGRRHPRWLAGSMLAPWLLAGCLGVLMLYLWGFTAHWAAWHNANLLQLSPLCLVLLPGGLRIARGRDGGRWFRLGLATVAAGAVLGLLLKLVLPSSQVNLPWIALLLPMHLALWHVLGRRTRGRA